MKHPFSIFLILLCFLGITACEPVTAINPYDETAAPELQKKGQLIGRLVLAPTDKYTHDYDAQPLQLQIKDWSTGLNVLDAQGQPVIYETRTSDATLPDSYDDTLELGAAGTFQIELAAGEYGLSFDAAANNLSYYYKDVSVPFFKVRPGGTVSLDVDIEARETPSCIYQITGEINGGIDGRSYEVDLINADTPTDIPIQTLTMSSDGRFRFECVDPSIQYRVKVIGENYAPAVSQRVNLVEDATVDQINAAAAGDAPPEDTTLTADIGELKLVTLGELFQIDYTLINEGRPATAQAEAPYTPNSTVPISLSSAMTFLSNGEGQGPNVTYRALATAGESPDYATLSEKEWTTLSADAQFDVLLNPEDETLSDGVFLITVQLRLCFADGDLEFCYASGYENLEIILDTQAPYLVSMELGGTNTNENIYLNCASFDVTCDSLEQALSQQLSFRAEIYDDTSRLSKWAGTFDESEPTTFNSLSATTGLAIISSETPAVAPQDATPTFHLWAADAAGNLSDIAQADFTVDVTPPSGFSLSINEGALYTSTGQVELTITSDDADATVILSNSAAFTNTISTSPGTLSWMLSSPSTEGEKRVYAKVLDEAGNEVITDDTIALDLTTPDFTITLPYGPISNAVSNDDEPSITLGVSVNANSTSGLEPDSLTFHAAVGVLTCEELNKAENIITLDADIDSFEIVIAELESEQTVSVCLTKPSGLQQVESINVSYDNTPPTGEVFQCSDCTYTGNVAFSASREGTIMLEASASDTGSDISKLHISTFNLDNDVNMLLNGALFGQQGDQSSIFLTDTITKNDSATFQITLSAHTVFKAELASVSDSFFNVHVKNLSDTTRNFERNCDLSEDDSDNCQIYLANSSTQDISFEVTIGTTSNNPTPIEFNLIDLGLSNGQTETEVFNVGTIQTTIKTIELDQLDFGEMQLRVLVVEAQPYYDDDLDLKVLSLDASGVPQNALTCSPAINGVGVERCIIPIHPNTASYEIMVNLYDPYNDSEPTNFTLLTEYLVSNPEEVSIMDSTENPFEDFLSDATLLQTFEIQPTESGIYALTFDAENRNNNILVVGTFEDSAQSVTSTGNESGSLWFPLHFDADAPANFEMTLTPPCDMFDFPYPPCGSSSPSQPDKVASADIVVHLTGQDEGSTITISNDAAMSNAQTFTPPSMEWTLNDATIEGDKTVYIQILDRAGNATIITSSVYLDLNDPEFTTAFTSPQINNQRQVNFDINFETEDDTGRYTAHIYDNYSDCYYARGYHSDLAIPLSNGTTPVDYELDSSKGDGEHSFYVCVTEPSKRSSVQTLSFTLDTQAPSPETFACLDCNEHNGVYFNKDPRHQFLLEAHANDLHGDISKLEITAYHIDDDTLGGNFNIRDILNAYGDGERQSGVATQTDTEVIFELPASAMRHLTLTSEQEGTITGTGEIKDPANGQSLAPTFTVNCTPSLNSCETLLQNPTNQTALFTLKLKTDKEAQAFTVEMKNTTMTALGTPTIESETVTHDDKNALDHLIYTFDTSTLYSSGADNLQITLAPESEDVDLKVFDDEGFSLCPPGQAGLAVEECIIDANIYTTQLHIYASFRANQDLYISTNINLTIQPNEISVIDSSQYTMEAVMSGSLPQVNIVPASPLTPDTSHQYTIAFDDASIDVEDGLFIIVGRFVDSSGSPGNTSAAVWFPLVIDSQAPELIRAQDSSTFSSLQILAPINQLGTTTVTTNKKALSAKFTMHNDFYAFTFEDASDVITSSELPMVINTQVPANPGQISFQSQGDHIVAKTPLSLPMDINEGTQTYAFSISDFAGNTTSASFILNYDVTAPEILVAVHDDSGVVGSEHCTQLDEMPAWSHGACASHFDPDSPDWDIGHCAPGAAISEDAMWDGVLWLSENFECTESQTRVCHDGWGQCVNGYEIQDDNGEIIGCSLACKNGNEDSGLCTTTPTCRELDADGKCLIFGFCDDFTTTPAQCSGYKHIENRQAYPRTCLSNSDGTCDTYGVCLQYDQEPFCLKATSAECKVPVTITLEDDFDNVPSCPENQPSPPLVPFFFHVERAATDATCQSYDDSGFCENWATCQVDPHEYNTCSAARIECNSNDENCENCLGDKDCNANEYCHAGTQTCERKPDACAINDVLNQNIPEYRVQCCQDNLDGANPFQCEGYQIKDCTWRTAVSQTSCNAIERHPDFPNMEAYRFNAAYDPDLQTWLGRSTTKWVPKERDGDQDITICAWDLAGNMTRYSSTNIVDRQPPSITSAGENISCTNCFLHDRAPHEGDQRLYLTGGSNTAHFDLHLMDETTNPTEVTAMIYSGAPSENIQATLDAASSDWLEFQDEYDISYSTVQNESVAAGQWRWFTMTDLPNNLPITVTMSVVNNHDVDLIISWQDPDDYDTLGAWEADAVCNPKLGSGSTEVCNENTPRTYNDNDVFIGIKSKEQHDMAKFDLSVTTEGIQTDNSYFVTVPYFLGAPISINLPNLPDYASDKHLIFFKFTDAAGNEGAIETPTKIFTLPEPNCSTDGPYTSCTCPDGYTYEGGQCL